MVTIQVPGRAAAAVLVAVAVSLLLPFPSAAATSKLWGVNGNNWTPSGRLMDFSFAGYRQGNAPLPDPPVTRSVLQFKRGGKSDTDMLQAALAWAHKQPVTKKYTVLYIPKGTYTLTRPLTIKRPRIVLRGAGMGQTVLYIPKSLTDIYGPDRTTETGGYVNWGGFLTIKGSTRKGPVLATATGRAERGDFTVTVHSARALRVGQYVDTWWTDIGGKFHSIHLGANWKAPELYNGKTRIRYTSKVVRISGNRVTLERALPYPIKAGVNRVTFHPRSATVTESGVEGMTLNMKWERYGGHHLERGWNGVELMGVYDCWARDIEIINPDNGVLVNYLASSSTVKNIRISYTKTRANTVPNRFNEPTNTDGHWGIMYASQDILFDGFNFRGTFQHDVGTGIGGYFGVFMNGKLSDGNLDLHRGLAGPSLFTNIDVGVGSKALASGGPRSKGPNAAAYSTWWNIKSNRPVSPNYSNGEKPGSCGVGPVMNLVGVHLRADQVREMCKTWWYERSPKLFPNLYEAQLALRQGKRRG